MSEFNKDAVAILNRITAKNIATKMRDVRNGRKKYERSWIWELIQNAKDKTAIDFPKEKVSISIKLQEDKLYFSHNFGYFTSENIEGLIRQTNTSDKDREETDKSIKPETTGRFGTGFMTTHLLSEKVNIKGLYKNNKEFNTIEFPIDRSSIEIDELINSINTSFEQAEDSLNVSTPLGNINFSKI